MKEIPKRSWVEINDPDDIEIFQEIVALITSFDEKTGRHLAMEDGQEEHIKRKMITSSRAKDLEIFISPVYDFVYLIVVRFPAYDGQFLETMWVHEDRISQERQEIGDEPEHPCFNVACIADLLEKSSPVQNQELKEIGDSILFRNR